MTGPTPVRPTTAPMHRLLRSELALVVPRPRTAATLSALLVIPLMAAFGLHALGSGVPGLAVLPVSAHPYTAPVLVVPVVLVAADAFGAERAHRTLDLLRLAPVGDARLVALKSAGVLVTALLGGTVTALVALLAGLVLLGAGDYSIGGTLGRGIAIGLWLSVQLAGLGVLLLPLSMLVRRTTGIVAVGLLLCVVAFLPNLPGWVVAVLPNGGWESATTALTSSPVDWSPVLGTAGRAAVYALVGAVATVWLLRRRDE
ncbi:ABC transporter permease [Pseudonocardia endophytica]|uniref:ABC-2 type transport system permease protein n=1 Tax=Pseudonocardia endophytica TaxID=401976 RepID=A0A4R1HYD8_PSEEN|nr:ABC transporter permease [Pseudonocardia endophytica]TCK26541.1 ABC-2 type transport system permease protein [Pseudonocardia endophytica]